MPSSQVRWLLLQERLPLGCPQVRVYLAFPSPAPQRAGRAGPAGAGWSGVGGRPRSDAEDREGKQAWSGGQAWAVPNPRGSPVERSGLSRCPRCDPALSGRCQAALLCPRCRGSLCGPVSAAGVWMPGPRGPCASDSETLHRVVCVLTLLSDEAHPERASPALMLCLPDSPPKWGAG